MPSASCHLIELLPEVQECLSGHFAVVDCSLGAGPDLSRPPFNLSFRNLGSQLTLVPDSSVAGDIDSGLRRLPLSNGSLVLTDGAEGTAMEVALQRGAEWRSPLCILFNRLFSSKWTFLVAEVEGGAASFHVLSSSAPAEEVSTSSATRNFSLWIIPITRIFAVPPPPKKVKIIKKVVKKKSPVEGEAGGDEATVVKKVVKVVRKKAAPRDVDPPVEGVPETPLPSFLPSLPIIRNGSSNALDKSSSKSSINSDSDKKSNGSGHGSLSNGVNGGESPAASSAPPPPPSTSLPPSPPINGSPPTNGHSSHALPSSDDEDVAEKLRAQIREHERRGRLEETRRDLLLSARSPSRSLLPIMEGETRPEEDSLPLGRSGTFMNTPRRRLSSDSPPPRPLPDSLFSSSLARSSSTIAPRPPPTGIPFTALQLVLKRCFSYEQLGNLRRVHPHWDELCGQLLNSGYYCLLERSEKLLRSLQRKAAIDSAFHYPVSVLTNIQVHILNPVDIMRAALDEGICCFPYGLIIDRTLRLLDEIEWMILTGEQVDCAWESVAVMAKRASLHYRSELEEIMDDRLGTCAQLKAAQKIIRMDSMIVEHNVQKLEKESAKARDELRWELEQVQAANAQMKKENRQLKQDQMRLEARVDALEHKFKTIARMLQ